MNDAVGKRWVPFAKGGDYSPYLGGRAPARRLGNRW